MIASIISAIASAIRLLTEWMARRREEMFVALGRAQRQTEDLEARYDALREATKARETARADAIRDRAAGLPDDRDDGFRRD